MCVPENRTRRASEQRALQRSSSMRADQDQVGFPGGGSLRDRLTRAAENYIRARAPAGLSQCFRRTLQLFARSLLRAFERSRQLRERKRIKNMQQQEFIAKATTAVATTRIKRDVMAGMLESLTLLAMKKRQKSPGAWLR